MNIPQIVKNLISAQGKLNSLDYSSCFLQTAIVIDEGKTHSGRTEIAEWFTAMNNKYHSVMKPISFEGDEQKGILETEITGTFPGSPLIFNYNLTFDLKLIQSLKITL